MGFASVAALSAALDQHRIDVTWCWNSSFGYVSTITPWECFTPVTATYGSWNAHRLTGKQVMSDASTGAVQHGGNVSPATKHIVSAYGYGNQTLPMVAVLVDLLAVYPSLSMNVREASLDNASPITRYTDGAGNLAFAAFTGLYPGAISSEVPRIRQSAVSISYRDADAGEHYSDGLQWHTPNQNYAQGPGSLAGWCTDNRSVGGGPFFSLEAGSSGVREVTGYRLMGMANAGTFWIGICHPLLFLSVPTQMVQSERDTLFHGPLLPRVHDGAHLGWLILAGATNSYPVTWFGCTVTWA